MKRPVILALVASAALLGAGAAHAGNVHWSVGVNLPPVATVISNGPVWGAPAYYPAPVTYAPQVVYEAPVVYPSYDVYPSYGIARPIVYGPRIVERSYYGHRPEWRRGPPGRDARWVPPGHRDERRHPHRDRGDRRH
ncbi:MAG: glutelin [Caldimonas sp.]